MTVGVMTEVEVHGLAKQFGQLTAVLGYAAIFAAAGMLITLNRDVT
jgi:hypothetical protein